MIRFDKNKVAPDALDDVEPAPPSSAAPEPAEPSITDEPSDEPKPHVE